MAVTSMQLVLGAGATQLATTRVNANWVMFQNNAAAVMRLSDVSVSATRGIALTTGALPVILWPFAPGETISLGDFWVFGTVTQVLDVVYDSVVF